MSRSQHSNIYPGALNKLYFTPKGIGSVIVPHQEPAFTEPSLIPREILDQVERNTNPPQKTVTLSEPLPQSNTSKPPILIMPSAKKGGRPPSGKRPPSAKKVRFPVNLPRGGGTLGGGAAVMTYDRHSTATFTQAVRERFHDHPAVYRRFVQILSEIQSQHTDKLAIIQQVIELFDGHPDLISSFNAFLPEGYTLEIQDDAVVVKIFESQDSMELVETGHSRMYPEDGAAISPASSSNDTVAYVKSVREIYRKKSQVYRNFIALLQDYHSKQIDELETIQRIVALFQKRADLVLGFNKFLPRGFTIRMYDKSAYVIEYPKRKDDLEAGKEKVTILLDSKYVRKR